MTYESRITSKDDKQTRGAILIVVLLVLVVMSLVVLQFSFSMTTNRMISENITEGAQLSYLAQGGLAYVENLLRVDRQQGEDDSFHDSWANCSPPYSSEFETKVEVQDECGKLNVNALTSDAGVNLPLKEALERLLLNMEINIEVVHRLVDYIDTNIEGEFEGDAKNAPLNSLTELLEIEYITPENFFGHGTGEDRVPGLVDFLTIHGPGLVNVNTAPDEVIRALFGKGEDQLTAFNEYREDEVFTDVEELIPLGMTTATEISQIIGFSSDHFRVLSRASSGRITRTVECVLVRGSRKIKRLEQRSY